MSDPNVDAYANGGRFRLEVSTANLMKANPTFARTKAEARRIRASLRESGFVVTVFSVSEGGRLGLVRL